MQWLHLLDFLLILIYTGMFSLLFSWLFKRSFQPSNDLRLLNLVAVPGGLFDIFENIWIMILIRVWPAQPKPIAWLASFFTAGKYFLGLPIILLILIGFFLAAKNQFKIQN